MGIFSQGSVTLQEYRHSIGSESCVPAPYGWPGVSSAVLDLLCLEWLKALEPGELFSISASIHGSATDLFWHGGDSL